jgi:hypothetical protein
MLPLDTCVLGDQRRRARSIDRRQWRHDTTSRLSRAKHFDLPVAGCVVVPQVQQVDKLPRRRGLTRPTGP